MASEDPSPHGSGSSVPESTLVHGEDELGVAALATGLALRFHGKFRWVDCSRSSPIEDLPTHWIFARGSRRPETARVNPADLGSPSWKPSTLHQLVAPAGPEEASRLASYLALPEFFQRLAARDLNREDQVAILLANVDSLPPDSEDLLVAGHELHDRLHRAGVSVYATARGPPSGRLKDAFDKVYRLEAPPGVAWSHGVVVTEKDSRAEGRIPPRPLRGVWKDLGLDATLLPPV